MRPLKARLDRPEHVASRGPLSDAGVVARFCAGDQRLLESLVGTQHAVMIAGATRYGKTREAAEEVLQETRAGVLRGPQPELPSPSQ